MIKGLVAQWSYDSEMSVTTKHAAYIDYEPTWEILRDAFEGSGAVKSKPDRSLSTRGVRGKGTKYLARPAGMRREEQYAAYRDRSVWLGATERAVQLFRGAVFRRPPSIVGPDRLEPLLRDITRTGISMERFAELVFQEMVLMRRVGVLVDYPEPLLLADGTAIPPSPDSVPYLVPWDAEEIINWRHERVGGDTVLTLVVLKECIEASAGVFPSPDFFTLHRTIQYRVLRLNEDGFYEVSLWREREYGRAARPQEPVADLYQVWIPLRAGVPLSFIPFYLEPTIEKSILEGLVEVNYQYYRHSADYEHGLHLTALPTPYITGHTSEHTVFEIGSAVAWMIPDAQARVGMLEFQGQGLQSHERAMEADLKNMAMLGARLLEAAPAGRRDSHECAASHRRQ